MITACVGIAIVAIGIVLYGWAFCRARMEDSRPSDRMIPPELKD